MSTPNVRSERSDTFDTTRPVGATLSWEEYCSQLGVDPSAARDASLVRALHAELRRLDAALTRAVSAVDLDGGAALRELDAKPSEPSPPAASTVERGGSRL